MWLNNLVFYNSWRDTGGFDTRRRSGRPRATTAATDRAIKRAVNINPVASSLSIAAALQTPISARTVRLSTECDLKAHRSAKKPPLTRKNIKDRLSFAKNSSITLLKCGRKCCGAMNVISGWWRLHRRTSNAQLVADIQKNFVPKQSKMLHIGWFGAVLRHQVEEICTSAEYNYERRTILVGPRRTLEADDAHSQLHNVHAWRRSMPHVASREIMAWE